MYHIGPYRDSDHGLGYIPEFRTFGSSGLVALTGQQGRGDKAHEEGQGALHGCLREDDLEMPGSGVGATWRLNDLVATQNWAHTSTHKWGNLREASEGDHK